jgi:hypothetical protein
MDLLLTLSFVRQVLNDYTQHSIFSGEHVGNARDGYGGRIPLRRRQLTQCHVK